MGSLSLPSSGSVYLDSNCIIYRVEQIEPYHDLLRPVFRAASDGAISLLTSELSVLECLDKPVQEADQQLEELFRAVLLGSREMRLLPVSGPVLERAVRLRAAYGLKTPDAIHAATALEAACEALLTNDPVFLRVPDLASRVLKNALP